MIHVSISMCHISVDIKAERRGKGQLQYLAYTSPPADLQPPLGKGGAQMILDEFIAT